MKIKKYAKKIDLDKITYKKLLKNFKIVKKHNKKSIHKFIKSYTLDSSIVDIVNTFYQDNIFLNINRYEFDLLALLILCKKLLHFYKKNDLSKSLFYKTIKDIKYKVDECIGVKKVHGVFVLSWYQGIFFLKCFAFGRLQYQICPFGMDVEGFSKDQIGLRIHIPRDGHSLDSERIEKSLKHACKFFKKYLHQEKILFSCYSWLLFTHNKEFLNQDSNIIKFANRFKIVETTYNDDYSELWRIFNVEIDNVDNLVDSSSLAHGYIEMMKNNKKVGESFGYFVR